MVLVLGCCELVLGVQWFSTLRPITRDEEPVDEDIDIIEGNGATVVTTTNEDKSQLSMNYSHAAPKLQRPAIKILSLTCSSSGCKCNWSAFEQVIIVVCASFHFYILTK